MNVEGKESKLGTSFYNQDEVDVVRLLSELLTQNLENAYKKN